MKSTKLLLGLSLLFLITTVSAKSVSNYTKGDSVNVLMYFSVFNESFKNKDYKGSLEYGWVVLKNNPKPVLKFNFLKKMEEALDSLYANQNLPEAERNAFRDSMLVLMDHSIQVDPEKKANYLTKKAYVLQAWYKAEAVKFIPLYEEAIKINPKLAPYYRDLLGIAYIQNADDSKNDYTIKALEIYNKLSEEEPSNDTWNSRLTQLSGGDQDKLVEIKKKSWDLNKDNTEKAFDYANTCIRAKQYQKAIEPLNFLISKEPNVLNYWKLMATAESKLENKENTIKAYKKLIELEPNNKENYVNMAITYKEMKQYSTSRTYLQKAIALDANYDFAFYIEGQLYEDAARSCSGGKIDFMDKCVFQLAVDMYNKVARMGGSYAESASARAAAFSTTVPAQEEFFFKGYKAGSEIRITGDCYSWIGRSVYAK